MIRVGVTGGIGAGKTRVCNMLEEMGYPIFSSDDAAKKIMHDDPEVVKKVAALFGEAAYIDNELNRKYLAQQIFNDEGLKEALNNIVHPAVRNAFEVWSQAQNAEIVFNEAAILFETGQYKRFDYTLLITAPVAVRIERVVKRDKTTPEEVEKRMESQWTDEEKLKLASFVIINDGEKDILPQLEEVLSQIKSKQ